MVLLLILPLMLMLPTVTDSAGFIIASRAIFVASEGDVGESEFLSTYRIFRRLLGRADMGANMALLMRDSRANESTQQLRNTLLSSHRYR